MRPHEIKLEPEKVYHIYNRAHGSEKLFLNENHYYEFLQKYALYIPPIADTLAYCLLPNHFHIMVKLKDPHFIEVPDFNEVSYSSKISKQFGKLFSSYSQWFNLKTERKGGLFMSGFKRKPVEDPFYFTELFGYIHTNPVKHGLVEDAMDWTFSSIHAYALNDTSSKSGTSMKCHTDIILDFFGGSKEDLLEFHRNYNEKVVEMQGLGLE